MADKLEQYFQAGVRLVWYIDPETKTARSYTGVDDVTQAGQDGMLDGGEVLPGFTLSLKSLFTEANRQHPTQ